jgi:uncharacterized protein (DUF433 family)
MLIPYPHITLDPAVHGGRPCIGSTGIRVTEVATVSEDGRSALKIQEYFQSHNLTLAEIYSALAYFEDNREELALVQAEEKRLSDAAERDRLERIRRFYLGESEEKPGPKPPPDR